MSLAFQDRRRDLEWADFDNDPPATQFHVITSSPGQYGSFPSVENDREILSVKEVENALDPGWRMFVWIPLCFLTSRIWGSIRFWFDAYELFHYSLPMIFQNFNALLLYLQVSLCVYNICAFHT